MASVYKSFTANDITTTRTLLHEAIPITGSILSGTYAEENIKDYSHGMFQSVYDYPYLSSSANHLFDVTIGYSNSSPLSASAATQNAKKINIYNQMAQVLMGADVSGSVLEFDQDGNILGGGNKIDACMFLNFSRLLTKDEIKKGSFSITFATGGTCTALSASMTISDTGSVSSYKVNSPAGEYGLLFSETSFDNVAMGDQDATDRGGPMGLVFYQAGVAVITASVFNENYDTGSSETTTANDNQYLGLGDGDSDTYDNVSNMFYSASISGSCNAIRNRIENISFNNTTELHSTIYFCRVNHNEFNYSANPTYLTASKLRVKNQSTDSPVSYITSIGLYSQSNELMATAKLSEPLKKTPENEITLRVRLDY
jgi:hypothetical protein